jgi:hypothetical protein
MAQLKVLAAALLLACGGAAQAQAQAPPGARDPLAQVSPTQLLFDAISVGNTDVVREAIARGANLNARNVLGQRPVDLAIDVGRSDIAFTLLSLMRAGEPPRAQPLPPDAGAGGRAPAARRAEPPPVPARPRTPVLWANDGGAPQPEIGFLGFDASRPEGTRAPAASGRRPPG